MEKHIRSPFIKRYGVEEAERLIRLYSERGDFLKKLSADHQTTPTTIKKFIKMYMPGFEYTKKLIEPKDYTWLINGSINETIAFVTQLYINEDKQFTFIMNKLGAEKNQLTYFLSKYITPKKQVSEQQNKDIERENNRLFSIHVIGSKPEALDKYKEVA